MTKFNASYIYEGKTEGANQVKVDIGTIEDKYDLVRAVIQAIDMADDTYWTQLNSITITRLNDDGTPYESELPFSQHFSNR